MSVGKASIKRAASAETKKTTDAGRGKGRASQNVKTSVVTPMDSEKLQVLFLKDKPLSEGEKNRPVRITEELPDYLL